MNYYGSRMNLREQPDLSLHQSVNVFLDRNNIHVIYRDLLPALVKTLKLSMNSIYSDGLPVSWPNSLESLNLEDNHILDTYIVQSWPSTLRELLLDSNPLEIMPQGLPDDLQTLSMSYCYLREIPRLPSELKILRVFYNRLKSFDVLPIRLEYCNLAHNLLTSKIFSRPLPSSLTYLNLDSNSISWLPKNLPDSLETLIISNNNLTQVPRIIPRNLCMLVLCNNKIKSFTVDWKPGQRIKSVFIRNNCLVENLLLNSQIEKVYQADNWNQEVHSVGSRLFQKAFRRYKLKKGMRTWKRVNGFYKEMFDVAMHPNFVNRWNTVETWSQWKR